MSLKFSIMITSVALAAILAECGSLTSIANTIRGPVAAGSGDHLVSEPKPLAAFALTDHKIGY